MNLREAIRAKEDGWWEWEALGVAAGFQDYLERVVPTLRGAYLLKPLWEQKYSPPRLLDQVEAVAAYSPTLLAELAREWLVPRDIGPRFELVYAWLPALRHVHPFGLLTREEAMFPELRREVAVLWDPPPQPAFRWHELAEQVRQQKESAVYDFVRRFDGSRMLDTRITADDLRAVPPIMMRLLRGRLDRLDSSAQDLLATTALNFFRSDEPNLLAIELCKALGMPVVEPLQAELAEQLPTISEPQKIMRISFMLLTDWRPA